MPNSVLFCIKFPASRESDANDFLSSIQQPNLNISEEYNTSGSVNDPVDYYIVRRGIYFSTLAPLVNHITTLPNPEDFELEYTKGNLYSVPADMLGDLKPRV